MKEFGFEECESSYSENLPMFSLMLLRLIQTAKYFLKGQYTKDFQPAPIDHSKAQTPCIICGNVGGFLQTHHRVPRRMGGEKARGVNTQDRICGQDHRFLDEQTYQGIIYTGTPEEPFQFTEINNLSDIYFRNNEKPQRYK